MHKALVKKWLATVFIGDVPFPTNTITIFFNCDGVGILATVELVLALLFSKAAQIRHICTDQGKTNVGAVFLSDVVDNVLVLA